MADDAQLAIVAAVTKNAWRQGCILPPEAHPALQKCVGRPIDPECVCIVITHSCDLVRPDPSFGVEVVIASPTGRKLNGTVAHGRSRKRLELLVTVSGIDQTYEIKAQDRFDLPLHVFAEHTSDAARTLADDQQRFSLIEWLVARYARPGLPDAFESRISAQRKQLAKAAEKLATVWRIYVGLTPWNELSEHDSYGVELRFVMRVEDYEVVAKRGEALKSVEGFLTALKACQGLTVPTDPQEVLFSEDEVTLFEERHLLRWEKFDYVSFADPVHVQDKTQI